MAESADKQTEVVPTTVIMTWQFTPSADDVVAEIDNPTHIASLLEACKTHSPVNVVITHNHVNMSYGSTRG